MRHEFRFSYTFMVLSVSLKYNNFNIFLKKIIYFKILKSGYLKGTIIE